MAKIFESEEEEKEYWGIRIQCNECEHNGYCEIPQEKKVKPCKDYQMSRSLWEFLHSHTYGPHGGLSHELYT